MLRHFAAPRIARKIFHPENEEVFKRKKITIPILFERLKNYYWMIPAVVIALMIGSLPLMLSLDRKFFSQTFSESLFTGYSPDGARLILSSVCTSVMTVIGVLFSITIVVIQQASAQYSPRIVEVFIKSRTSQMILGLYAGTFVYGILLLRQIPSGNSPNPEIPQSAVSLGIIYSLVCIVFLVHYVHFISHLIRSTRIIETIRDETLKYQKDYGQFLQDSLVGELFVKNRYYTTEVRAEKAGYFQSYLAERIDNVLEDHSARIILHKRIGTFITKGEVLASITSKEEISEKEVKKLRACLEIGSVRTHAQDIDYGVRQLVDIALRGLSPGINDPTTASEALNAIEVILTDFVEHFPRGRYLKLENGTVMEVPVITLEELLRTAFSQILVFSGEHYPILEKISSILTSIKKRSGMVEPEPVLLYEEKLHAMMRGKCFQGIIPESEENPWNSFS